MLWRSCHGDNLGDVKEDFFDHFVQFKSASTSSPGGVVLELVAGVAVRHLVAVRIDRGMLMAVRDRLAAVVAVAVQNVLKLGRAANLARQRRVVVAWPRSAWDAGRDRSPVSLAVVLDDDLVLAVQAAMEDDLRWFEAGFVAPVSATQTSSAASSFAVLKSPMSLPRCFWQNGRPFTSPVTGRLQRTFHRAGPLGSPFVSKSPSQECQPRYSPYRRCISRSLLLKYPAQLLELLFRHHGHALEVENLLV